MERMRGEKVWGEVWKEVWKAEVWRRCCSGGHVGALTLTSQLHMGWRRGGKCGRWCERRSVTVWGKRIGSGHAGPLKHTLASSPLNTPTYTFTLSCPRDYHNAHLTIKRLLELPAQAVTADPSGNPTPGSAATGGSGDSYGRVARANLELATVAGDRHKMSAEEVARAEERLTRVRAGGGPKDSKRWGQRGRRGEQGKVGGRWRWWLGQGTR